MAELALTVPHYFDFGGDRELVGADLVRADRWDALRTRTTGAFAMAGTRDELERQLRAWPEIVERAAAIAAQLGDAETVASYGVGGAILEAALLRFKQGLIVSDYAPETVLRLQRLLPAAEVVEHDLRQDEPLRAQAHLFHRIDTELCCSEWRQLFRRFGGERVIFIPGEVASIKRLGLEVAMRIRRRGRASRAGWLRNRATVEALWRETHLGQAVRFHDLDGWVLEPR